MVWTSGTIPAERVSTLPGFWHALKCLSISIPGVHFSSGPLLGTAEESLYCAAVWGKHAALNWTLCWDRESSEMELFKLCCFLDALQIFHLHYSVLPFSCSSLNHTPKLQRWMEAMKDDPAVKATITDPQIYKNYLQLYLKNSPEACDYGLWGASSSSHLQLAEAIVPFFSVIWWGLFCGCIS